MSARILIVEDNSANLELMTYLLTAFGHAPLQSRDGVEALEALSNQRVDLVVCDIQLPRMDGYEVLRNLRSSDAWRGLPVVAVTALAMVGDRDRVLAAGFNGYIGKPINPETFVAQVDVFLPTSLRSVLRAGVRKPCEESPLAPAGLKRGEILVVDSVRTNRELACSVLEPRGFVVIQAEGMAEALGLLRHSLPGLILSDVGMADATGFDFVLAIKADPRLAAIPFIFLTASHDNERDRTRGLALGANGYLCRPIEPLTLLTEIESLITIMH